MMRAVDDTSSLLISYYGKENGRGLVYDRSTTNLQPCSMSDRGSDRSFHISSLYSSSVHRHVDRSVSPSSSSFTRDLLCCYFIGGHAFHAAPALFLPGRPQTPLEIDKEGCYSAMHSDVLPHEMMTPGMAYCTTLLSSLFCYFLFLV